MVLGINESAQCLVWLFSTLLSNRNNSKTIKHFSNSYLIYLIYTSQSLYVKQKR